MAAWPSTLPAPLAEGYKLSVGDQCITTEMEGGNKRKRRITNARNDTFSIMCNFDQTQMATFRAWYDSSTGADGGAAWFDLNLITGDGASATVEARMSFTGADFLGRGRWAMMATVEVRYA